MRQPDPLPEEIPAKPETLTVNKLGFAYRGGAPVLQDITFTAQPGRIFGITGAVACGKSTLGKAFLCELPYTGSIRYGGREMAHPRPLLVLDDPFSALDRKTEEQVFDNLRKMTAGSTVLLISHRLYLFPQMDGVLWIQDGKAVCAAHKELMAQNPQYAALVNAQEGGEQDEPEK